MFTDSCQAFIYIFSSRHTGKLISMQLFCMHMHPVLAIDIIIL